MAIFDELITNNKTGYSTRTRRANVLREQGEFAKAQAEYDAAIAAGEKYSYTYYNRALLFEKMGQKDNAVADLKQAVELSPEYKDANDLLDKLTKPPAKKQGGTKPRVGN